jgi:hypothetical protein
MSIKILTKLYSKKLCLIVHLNTYAVAVDCRSTAFGILQLKLDQRVQVLYGMNFARGVVRIPHLSKFALLALDDGHVVQLIYGDSCKRDYGHCSDDSTGH